MEVILPKPPAKVGPCPASRPGLCPDFFWISLRMETPQARWVSRGNAWSSSQWQKCVLMPPVFHFALAASCPVTGYIWKEPGSTSLVFTLYLRKTSLNFLFSSLQNFILQKLYSRCHQTLQCTTYIYLDFKNIFWDKGSFLSNKIIEDNKIWKHEEVS